MGRRAGAIATVPACVDRRRIAVWAGRRRLPPSSQRQNARSGVQGGAAPAPAAAFGRNGARPGSRTTPADVPCPRLRRVGRHTAAVGWLAARSRRSDPAAPRMQRCRCPWTATAQTARPQCRSARQPRRTCTTTGDNTSIHARVPSATGSDSPPPSQTKTASFQPSQALPSGEQMHDTERGRTIRRASPPCAWDP
jgi:hypothetical protein